MDSKMISRNTRLIDITVGDLLDFLAQKQQAEQPKDCTATASGERYVYGLAGLASLFGCSKRAASNLKASGKIDKAIVQEGRKIIIDAQLAFELVTRAK